MFTSSIRSSFALKIVLGLLLVAAADWLLFLKPLGIALGLFSVLLLAAASMIRRGWHALLRANGAELALVASQGGATFALDLPASGAR